MVSLVMISSGRPPASTEPLIDNVSVIANAKCFAHIVIGNQDTDIAFFEKAHNTLNLNHRDRINTSKRFIQKNKAWIGRQGAGDFNSTTLTAREARAGLSRKPSICNSLNKVLRRLSISALPSALPASLVCNSSTARTLSSTESLRNTEASAASKKVPSVLFGWIGNLKCRCRLYRFSLRQTELGHNHIEGRGLARPFGPSKPTTSPLLTSSATSRTTWRMP